MNNIDVVNEVRSLLFHFMKEYTKTEDEHHVAYPSDVSGNTFKYLDDVKGLFKNFSRVIDDIYMTAMASKSYKGLKDE